VTELNRKLHRNAREFPASDSSARAFRDARIHAADFPTLKSHA